MLTEFNETEWHIIAVILWFAAIHNPRLSTLPFLPYLTGANS